ncbi:MAG TPA: polysaccharide deacetylase family protein [Rhizomicrobium sp.]|jgi:peptidoglycan/xylan/chitin deacetylase (PgdA/CDA1 family)|nr:polysaccharide deacetylase family protein [Rhizomicrobium sp.]
MKGSELLRKAARWVPGATLRPFGRPVALFFHGVTPRITDPRIEFNHHSVDAFRRIATRLKRCFDVLPLDALEDVLKRPERHTRTVFLMADDGYANTLEVAAPILDELHLPWTLFLSTQHIETGEWNPLISARLFLYFALDGRYSLPHLPQAVELGSAKQRETIAPSVLKALKSLPAEKARAAVVAMNAAFPARRSDSLRLRFASERYLTWTEVETLHKRGVEIGAHAHWHWPMNEFQPENYLHEQARSARQAIVSRLGRCRFFAYPFGNLGDVSPQAVQAVREAGYGHAFTTLSGTLRGNLNPWYLPRYALRPEEPNLESVLPMLRFADRRVARLGIPAAPAAAC